MFWNKYLCISELDEQMVENRINCPNDDQILTPVNPKKKNLLKSSKCHMTYEVNLHMTFVQNIK